MTLIEASLEPIKVRHYGASGPTLVVLHGGPGAPGSAAGLARSFADSFVVLEPLQRRSGPVPLTVALHIEDLRAIAPQPAIIVGWSWGAMLGLSYAARYPQSVSALVLVGCGTYDQGTRTLLNRTVDTRLGPGGREYVAALSERLASESRPRMRDAIFARLGAAYMQAESHALLPNDTGRPDKFRADERGYVETWNDVLRRQREGIEPEAFRNIASPVLMIQGDCDPHPGPATHDLLQRYIPQLEYVELARCGHEPWRERYARSEFVATVRRWCHQYAS